MRRRPALPAVAAALAAATLLAGCSSPAGDTAAGSSGEQGFVAGDGSLVILPEGEREAAPELTGETLEGGTWSLAEQQGRVVVMNVWASWCAPCRAEAPALARVADEMKQEVSFVGINTRDSDAPAKAFASRFDVGYPNLRDPDGELTLLFRKTLPPQAIPSTVVIDRKGRVAARALGKVSSAELRTMIASVDKGFGNASSGQPSGVPE